MSKTDSSSSPRGDQPSATLIVPLIKRAEPGDDPALQLPARDEHIIERLTGDLLVSYVFDLPGYFQHVSRGDCDDLQLSPRELRPLSVTNLVQRRSRPELRPGEFGIGFVLDGDLESSLLLVDHVWAQVELQVPGELIAAAPTRDTLMVTGTGVGGGTAALERAIEKTWQSSEPRLLLTRSLLIRRGNAWQAR